MSRREPIRAAFWWQTVGNQFRTLAEFLHRAQAATRTETGHECGHRFEITVRSSLHTSGPGEHHDADADWWGSDNDRPVVVRAHNLRDALLIAATLPLTDWFDDETEASS